MTGQTQVAPHFTSFPIDELESSIEHVSANDPELAAALADALAVRDLVDELIIMRKRAGLTQTAVAKLMEVRQPTVSQFETESSDPRISTLQRYARAVGSRVVVHVINSRGVFGADSQAYEPTARAVRVSNQSPRITRGRLSTQWAQSRSEFILAA